MKNTNYIDIFAGCGGLSLGLYNAGFEGVFAVEKNLDAFSTLDHNLIKCKKHFNWPKWLPIENYDINVLMKTYQKELMSLRGKIDLVAGGPPCQGFSMAGKRDSNDKRNALVKSYVKFIRLVQPEALIFENVHGFTLEFNSNDTRKYSNYVVSALKRLGYKTSFRIVNMSEFGVPQTRKRFILVAMKSHDPELVFNKLYENKSNFLMLKGLQQLPTVFDAIDDISLSCGTVQSPDTLRFRAGVYGNCATPYQHLMRQGAALTANIAVDSHRFVNHTEQVLELHKELLNKAPRGKRITPSDNIVSGLKRRGVTVLDPKLPAPTITSIPDELVHYREPRILTVREHARIQSFPDWYQFKGKYTSGGKRRKMEVPRYTQVGNAVPPLFAEQIGKAILEVLNDDK